MIVHLTESGLRVVEDIRGRDPVGARIDSHESSTPLWMYFSQAERFILSELEAQEDGMEYQALGRKLPSHLRKDYKKAIEALRDKWQAIRVER